jgi:aspartate racemase
MRILARIRKIFGVDVDLRALLDAPTVAELAELVGERLAARTDPGGRPSLEHGEDGESLHLVQLQPGHGPRPVFFIPGGVGGEGEFFVYARLARHVGPERPFYGLKARSSEGRAAAPDRVETMASHYLGEIRSRQPHGPYIVVGECAGGVVAYEIAQQLRTAGHEVALLVLMDTPRPDDLADPRAHFVHITRWSHHRERLRRLRGKDKLGYLVRAAGWLLRTMGRAPAGDVREIQRSYVQAIYRYRPQPYAGKLTLLLNEEVSRISPSLGWAGLAAGGIEIRRVPGNHISYIRGNVQATARALRECIRQAEGVTAAACPTGAP